MPVTKSILRYPGGKTRLTSFVAHLIEINDIKHPVYCEPFCGGAGIAMSLLLADRVESIVLNDLDSAIYSVWYATIYDTERFVDRIQESVITVKEWCKQREIYREKSSCKGYSFELAYAAFFLNRTNRSGIIGGGPIGGYNQVSQYALGCRFNVSDLIEKIQHIASFRARIQIYEKDGIDFVKNVIPNYGQENLFIYFDPPYYKQGQFLYKNGLTDDYHFALAKVIQNLCEYKWITTYDQTIQIQDFYQNSRQFLYTLTYSAGRKRKEQELLFTNDCTVVESFDKVHLIPLDRDCR